MKLSAARSARLSAKIFGHIKNGTTDLADEVISFDPKIHTNIDVAARERSAIFEKLPIMVAHSAQIPEPDDFLTVQMNASNVLLSRQKDGSMKAFLNACRHRGGTVVTERQGKRKLFTCKYHGWSYGNDGNLKAINFSESFGRLACDDLGLVALPVEERHGFIWVVDDPKAPIDVGTFLGPDMDLALAEFGLADYHFFKGEVFEFPQNWKIMLDGLLDGYHVPTLHGKTIAPYVYHNILATDFVTEHAFWATPRRRIDEVLNTPPSDVSLNRYVIFGAAISPNTELVIHPHHIEFWTIFQDPANPNRCRAHLRFITPRPMQTDEELEIMNKNWNILMAAVTNEDVPAGNGIQSSSAMSHTAKCLLGRNEILNQHFHSRYRAFMDGC